MQIRKKRLARSFKANQIRLHIGSGVGKEKIQVKFERGYLRKKFVSRVHAVKN
jgi:hypothetical protein